MSSWGLQVLWWLTLTLPIAAAIVGIVLVIRWLSGRARAIEERPVPTGPGGFTRLLTDKLRHLALRDAMLVAVIGGVAIGGSVGLLLQRSLAPAVQENMPSGPQPPPEAVTPPAHGASADVIFLAAMVLGSLTLGVAVRSYRRLRRQAADRAPQLAPGAARPLLVKWFHDGRAVGITLVVAASWVAFGLAMQVAGFLLLMVPWPVDLSGVSIPWAEPVVTGALVVLGIVLFLGFFAPSVWMTVRHTRLEVRYYREHPTFRFLANAAATLLAGGLGALVFLALITRAGVVGSSGDWLDLRPALWLVAFLVAYALGIAGRIGYRRSVSRRFNFLDIAIALGMAVPGAVMLAAVVRWLVLGVLA